MTKLAPTQIKTSSDLKTVRRIVRINAPFCKEEHGYGVPMVAIDQYMSWKLFVKTYAAFVVNLRAPVGEDYRIGIEGQEEITVDAKRLGSFLKAWRKTRAATSQVSV